MKRLLLIPLVLFQSLSFSSEAGAIFLLIKPSPTMNGMGGVGVSIPSNDIYSTYHNPANILLTKRLSFQTSKVKVNWLANLADDLYFDYTVSTVGYRFENYPIQLSLTKSEMYLSLGEQIIMGEGPQDYLGTFTSYMKSDAMTYSIGYYSKEYPIYFSIGKTDKTAKQSLVVLGAGAEQGSGTTIDSFYDWGYLLSFPSIINNNHSKINYSFTPSIGYSKSNIGGLISFIDPAQADPSPRTARFGISGILEAKDKSDQTLFKFTIVREAEDILFSSHYDSLSGNRYFDYQSGLGDISINKHILESDSEEDVIIYRGFELNILNAVSIRGGRYIDERGKINIKARGYGWNLKGILDLFPKNSFISDFTKYFNITYNYSRWNESPEHPLYNTFYQGYTLSFTNLNELIEKIL